MPPQRPLPKEIIDLSLESQLTRHSRKSQIIYLSIVISIVACIALLPYLYVDVSVKSPGLLRGSGEITIIKSASEGRMKKVLVKENEVVQEGQLLFELRSPILDEKILYLDSKIAELNRFLNDVTALIGRESADRSNNQITSLIKLPLTPLYNQSFADYMKKKAERETRFLKANQDYDRNKRLFDQRVISQVEYENFKFELDKTIVDLDLLKETQLSTWELERRSLEKEAADIRSQFAQAQWENANLRIKAPVMGTIQSLAGIYPGSSVFVNQSLAEISPDTDLLAEIHVSPSDIGLLHEGMEVRMQINAFNYNQWGLLNGKISEISNDIQLVNDQPIFEVKCVVDQNYLTLKNGYRGKFKKGMTLQARFIITKRSLWQLLYDKVDDWVNPNIKHS